MKAWAGEQDFCRTEVLKAYVGKMSFDDKKIKASVGLKSRLDRKWWTPMWVEWHSGPGESLCGLKVRLSRLRKLLPN